MCQANLSPHSGQANFCSAAGLFPFLFENNSRMIYNNIMYETLNEGNKNTGRQHRKSKDGLDY